MSTRKTTRCPGWREMMRYLHPAVWQAATLKQARELIHPTEVSVPVYDAALVTLAKGAARKRGFAQQLREDAALLPSEVGADYLAWAAQADGEADAFEAAALIASE
jgi:hypothetical protein